MEKLNEAIKKAGGLYVVAHCCSVSYEAVRKWTKKGLPMTDLTGKTYRAFVISALQDVYSEEELLEECRKQARPKRDRKTRTKKDKTVIKGE